MVVGTPKKLTKCLTHTHITQVYTSYTLCAHCQELLNDGVRASRSIKCEKEIKENTERERERERENSHIINMIWPRGGTTLGPRGAMAPPNFFFLNILLYMCVLILAILFYKITFYFPLTISLLLLRVMLYSQTFL